jgi:ADP-ribose pyrophosphatase YjhB (NUDIX family)
MIAVPRFCLRCGCRLLPIREGGRPRCRCPRCGWTFYGNPIPATVALIVRRGRVLLTRRARPPYARTWDLPGGFLEGGESPEAGLRRELREELGIAVGRPRFLGFETDRYGPGGFWVLALIYAVTPRGSRLSPADDISEARWFPLRALPLRAIAFPSMRRALRRLLTGR